MTTLVKICGLSTPDTMATALDEGADYVGLVFFPPSPRSVTIAEARPLATQARGIAKVVALVVDPDDELVRVIAGELAPDLIQLHGSETPARAAEIAALTGTDVMKAIKVADANDAATAHDYLKPDGPSDIVLFDAKAPPDAALPGGNGLTFDWQVLDNIRGRINYMLSGGLHADNVARAIKLTGAPAVDVSSGVEFAPGEKDPVRIRAFLKAAKSV